MYDINIRDLIFAFCRLGSFMVSVSTPEEALDHWDAREFERTKTSYDNLRSEANNILTTYTYSKSGNYYYTVPLVKRENHTVKHAVEIIPIEQETAEMHTSYYVFNKIFVEKNDTVHNFCYIYIPKNILTMNISKDESGIFLFEEMCKQLIQAMLKVLVNDNKAIHDSDIYKLYLILYKVFAKKLLSGSNLITFEDSPYPDECQRLYEEFNTFDPAHKFQTPMEQNINNIISLLPNMI